MERGRGTQRKEGREMKKDEKGMRNTKEVIERKEGRKMKVKKRKGT